MQKTLLKMNGFLRIFARNLISPAPEDVFLHDHPVDLATPEIPSLGSGIS
jgi:hypothetical protein